MGVDVLDLDSLILKVELSAQLQINLSWCTIDVFTSNNWMKKVVLNYLKWFWLPNIS